MKEKLVVIGAGGHSRVCIEIAEVNGYKSVVVLDDNSNGEMIYGKTDLFREFLADSDFIVAIGNNQIRKNSLNKLLTITDV